ncbi:MAG: TGS domain-containing protein [Caldilineaceae bacterium]
MAPENEMPRMKDEDAASMNAHDSTLERAFRLVEQVCAPDTSGESVQAARIQGNAVAHILDGWQAGLALQAAGLLHRLVCVGAVTPADVTAACGPRVASLCEDFLCLSATDAERKPRDASAAPSSAAFQFLDKPAQWPGRHVIYQRIRAYCAAYRDAELGFLQAAVLWHRFHVAAAGGIDRGVYREEATQLLGPFLEMLGMRQLRGELAEWLQRTDDSPAENPWQPLLDAIVTRLAVLLPTAIFDTQDTQTHIFEAYNTSFMTQREPQGLTVEILVDDEEECYAALHQIHHMFLPVENALTDNIGAGRVNGYRSIQTSVMVPVSLPKMPADVAAARIKHAAREQTRRQRINFRIATRTMDEINRWGMAAFLLRERLDDQLASGWWQNASAGYAQITSAPLGSLPPELFVFSPHGQLFRFERGCTVVDYAYHVHSELADRCSRFYVNGLPVEPGHGAPSPGSGGTGARSAGARADPGLAGRGPDQPGPLQDRPPSQTVRPGRLSRPAHRGPTAQGVGGTLRLQHAGAPRQPGHCRLHAPPQADAHRGTLRRDRRRPLGRGPHAPSLLRRRGDPPGRHPARRAHSTPADPTGPMLPAAAGR